MNDLQSEFADCSLTLGGVLVLLGGTVLEQNVLTDVSGPPVPLAME